MNNSQSYSLKVWLTTSILSPLLYSYNFHNQNYTLHSKGDIIGYILVSILFFAGVASPSCLIFVWLNKFIIRLSQNIFISKFIINLLGLILGTLPIMMIFTSLNYYNDLLSNIIIPYILVFTISIWLFTIEKEKIINLPKSRIDILDDDLDFNK